MEEYIKEGLFVGMGVTRDLDQTLVMLMIIQDNAFILQHFIFLVFLLLGSGSLQTCVKELR